MGFWAHPAPLVSLRYTRSGTESSSTPRCSGRVPAWRTGTRLLPKGRLLTTSCANRSWCAKN